MQVIGDARHASSKGPPGVEHTTSGARTRTSGTCQPMTALGLSQLGGADLDQGGQRRGQWPGKVIDRYSNHLQQEHEQEKEQGGLLAGFS